MNDGLSPLIILILPNVMVDMKLKQENKWFVVVSR